MWGGAVEGGVHRPIFITMIPVRFAQMNHEVAATDQHRKDLAAYAPDANIHPTLPLFVCPKTGMTLACFEVSDEELEMIQSTRRVWVVQPASWAPIAVKGISPLVEADDYAVFPETIGEEDDTDHIS